MDSSSQVPAKIRKIIRKLNQSFNSRPAEDKLAPQPTAMKTEMMDYQLHGLAWLTWRETQDPCGGILADDMGLGKTITMIALVLSSMENDLDDDDDDDELSGGTLVVCPASVIQQWGSEVTKHCHSKALSVYIHHGKKRNKNARSLASYDVVLTTYNLLAGDFKTNGILIRVHWNRIILDEAHMIRNYKTLTSRAVSALKGKRRWCLTGTPVQNKDLDVFALLKFLKLVPFNDLAVFNAWVNGRSHRGPEKMAAIMRCILLRRTKQQLQISGELRCLPKKEVHEVHVTLTEQEQEVYRMVLTFAQTIFTRFLHQRGERTVTPEDSGFLPTVLGGDENFAVRCQEVAIQGAKKFKSTDALVMLLRLRQVCCHCGLILTKIEKKDFKRKSLGVFDDPGSVAGSSKDLAVELNTLSLEETSRANMNENIEETAETGPESDSVTVMLRKLLTVSNPAFSLQRPSSKIKAVMECLRNRVLMSKGDKAVVVSQWTSVLYLLEMELKKLRVPSVTISGKVPVPSRPPIIKAFNDPKSKVKVMLLSLHAGGVGLNLCGANHLFLIDPHFNPQLEEQVQDRIYRVGQKKAVHIYRYVCLDTVEENIRSMQQAKLKLALTVLNGGCLTELEQQQAQTPSHRLSINDLKQLLSITPQPA